MAGTGTSDEGQAPAAGGLASVYMSCRGALARVVGRIVKRHDIEDILQDAFIRSFEAQGRYHIRNPRAFLLRTATNLALNHASRSGYHTTSDIEDWRSPGSMPLATTQWRPRWTRMTGSSNSAARWAACR